MVNKKSDLEFLATNLAVADVLREDKNVKVLREHVLREYVLREQAISRNSRHR
jgi:hypothetical protein